MGLSKRRDGSINNRGSVKSSWIAKIAGISLRSAKAARRVLISIGWLSEDTNSTQRKLNRTGAYFEINIDWPGQTQDERFRTSALCQGKMCVRKLHPLPQLKTVLKVAPPNKRHKTLSENKNQKTHPSGASKKQELGEPNLNNIQLDDLKKMSRLLKLYEQAVAQGWLEACEANLLFFIASAIRVKRTPCHDPIRTFIAIIRKDLRSHITQAQEDAARNHLHAYRQRQHAGSAAAILSRNQHDDPPRGLSSVKVLMPEFLQGLFERHA